MFKIFTQDLSCKEWKFCGIPQFSGGRMSNAFVDCGKGISDDGVSFMHTFFEVSDVDFKEYSEALKKQYELCFFNSFDGNLFYMFKTEKGLYYISFLKNTGTARFVLQDGCGVTPSELGYGEYAEKFDNTVFSQYSLHYDSMTKGTTCDCGMNYLFRLRDGSLIIIDGGEMEQSTDIAVDDYFRFIRELTGTKEDEKIRVSLWICTHAHDDHADFFGKLLLSYGEYITVERMAYNFPNSNDFRHSPTVEKTIKRITENNPEIKYIKIHAGMSFNIANASLEFFCSAEDAIALDSEDPFPGLNETSLSFMITAENKNALFLADMGTDNGDVFVDCFKQKVCNSDFLQAAHHGINGIENVYDVLKTKYLLLPQCRMNMETRFPEHYANFFKLYGKENVLLAHDKTYYFIMKDGEIELKTREHVGCPWDGSRFF